MAGVWVGAGFPSAGLTGCRRRLRGGSAPGCWQTWLRRWGLSRRGTPGEFVDLRPRNQALSCVVNSHKNGDLSCTGTAELRVRRAALVSRLPQAEGLLPGTLVQQRRRCGEGG